ncbi:Uncharacterized protein TCM_024324 [Theobroma cacao]|uniref:Integrase catalytic domain-containing protein n=1 Tax=Theobroma cacao TaxID=3641 RepID=A0A061EX30_THECC|nr:Uncharacterized protein TCM_024324 [Theobroma cacao]
MLDKLPKLSNNASICSVCQLGKISRKPFPLSSSNRTKSKLELIHSDIGGPLSEESLNGSKFYLLFIDDMTRWSWIFFMKFKSEVFTLFKNFKTRVEFETGHRIKTLRTDNGGEYTSNEFTQFLNQQGIAHQLTAPYTHQQNGVSERKNRIVMDMSKCLLYH